MRITHRPTGISAAIQVCSVSVLSTRGYSVLFRGFLGTESSADWI